jgi:hypothetical protein
MEINLDSEILVRAKFGGQTFELREPTVKQVQAFQKMMKDGDEMDSYLEFLEDLGLPKDVTENLGITKLQKLSEGLLGNFEKK